VIFLFQGRFSSITYSLIGDDNAQVLFAIDSNNGFIFVTSNGLIGDGSSVYKVVIVARKDHSEILQNYKLTYVHSVKTCFS